MKLVASLLALVVLLLLLAVVALATAPTCTITGTVYRANGTACANCNVTFRSPHAQSIGGVSVVMGIAKSVTLSSGGVVPAGTELFQGMIVDISVDHGPNIQRQIPAVSTTDLSTLLNTPTNIPLGTDINSLSGYPLTVGHGGTGLTALSGGKCIRSADDGSALEEAAADCGSGGGSGNSFETMNVPSGTDPVADSSTDTLNFTASGIVSISGDSTTDTITIGATEVGDVSAVGDCASGACFSGTTGSILTGATGTSLVLNTDNNIYLSFDTDNNATSTGVVIGSNASGPSVTPYVVISDSATPNVTLRNATRLRFNDTSDDTNYVELVGPSGISSNFTFTLPTDDGTSNQFLQTNGSGVLTWATPAGSGNVSNTGTPVDNQIAVWTNSTTIEGKTDLTWDSSTQSLTLGDGSLSGVALYAGVTGSDPAVEFTTGLVDCSNCRFTMATAAIPDISGTPASGEVPYWSDSNTLTREAAFSYNSGTDTLTVVNVAGNASTATALASNPSDCGADTYATTIAASGNLTCATVTNAGLAGSIAVSKTLLSDGAGILLSTNTLSTASSETGFITGSTSLPGTCGEGAVYQDTDSGGTETYVCTAANTWTKTVAATDNVATATALASNPSDCGADTYATTIAASGNLTCASITNASTTGTAVNTPSTLVLRDGSGNFAAGTITAALTGNASTATALAANPADCGADTYATTIAASGALTCSTVTNAGLAGSIALSKLANMSTDRLLGRDTASSGAIEELTVGGGIEFTGSGGIQRSAFSGGDVTASAGSATLTIGADKVTEAMLKAVDSPSDEECLTYESTVGDFEWQSCGSGSGITGITADSGGTTTGSTVTLTGGAGVATTRSTDTVTVATASTEQDFLAQSASLSCAGTTPGKLIVDTTTQTLSYCPTGSTTTKYAALGNDSGQSTLLSATSCTNGVTTDGSGAPSCAGAPTQPEFTGRSMVAGGTLAAYAVVVPDGTDDDEVVEAGTTVTSVTGCAQNAASASAADPVTVATAGIARCKTTGTVTAGSLVKIGATGAVTDAAATERPTFGRAITDASGGTAYILLNATVGDAARTTVFADLPAAGVNGPTVSASPFWDLPLTNAPFATFVSSNYLRGVLAFDASSDKLAYNSVMVPSPWTGALYADIYWLANATTGKVDWGMSVECIAPTEDEDPSFTTAVEANGASDSATDTSAAYDLNKTTLTVTLTDASCAAGDIMHIQLYRDANDATNDTVSVNALLLRVVLRQ